MKTFDSIISEIGGTVKAAALFQEAPSTISSWRDRGIPAAKAMDIHKALKKSGIKISADQVWEFISAKKKRK